MNSKSSLIACVIFFFGSKVHVDRLAKMTVFTLQNLL